LSQSTMICLSHGSGLLRPRLMQALFQNTSSNPVPPQCQVYPTINCTAPLMPGL
jgi:putative aminopeptidase FrvX